MDQEPIYCSFCEAEATIIERLATVPVRIIIATGHQAIIGDIEPYGGFDDEHYCDACWGEIE